MFTFRRAFGRVVPIFALGVFGACSAGKQAPSNLDPNESGGTGPAASGGASGSAGSNIIMMTGGTGGTGGTAGGIGVSGGSAGTGMTGAAGMMFTECASAKETGMQVPVDIYVMLDISGSMLDPAGGADTTMTKWDAVKAALNSFFSDPQSAGLNIAIQYFPLRIAGVPTSCSTDAECLGGAPCLTHICKLNPPGTLITCGTPGDTADCTNVIQRDDGPCTDSVCHLSGKACTDAAGCQTIATVNNGDTALGACVDYGVCQNDNTFSCADTDATTNPKGCGGTLGACVAAMPGTYFCAHETQCDPDAYATPAVDFIPLPDTAMTLNGSITAQVPLGDTPSRSALRGAIEHARAWSDAHVGHTVLVLFATDGLPTECTGGREISGESQLALDDTVAIATEGFTPAAAGTQVKASIQTFVIGVFAESETAAAQPNLDRIAKAGGTDHARVLSSAGDVKAEFLAELANLRASRLGCEYEIPQPKSGSTLDYNQVNAFLTQPDTASGMDKSTDLYYVPNGCTGAADEWHYDKAPTATDKPTKIVACPATCDALKMTQNAQVSIQLGCMQKIR